MNIGFWSCIILVIPFLIIGVLFAIFKAKAAKFVSGFNSFSKEEQALYDKAHISRDIRNQCFMWAIIMLAGALLSCFLTPYIAIPTYPATESEILQFIAYFLAIVVTIFFWGILVNTLSMLFRNMWMGIGSCLLIWVATNSTGGDKLFGAWNLFSYAFRDIENTADVTWLQGKALCIGIGLILLVVLPKIVRKRG